MARQIGTAVFAGAVAGVHSRLGGFKKFVFSLAAFWMREMAGRKSRCFLPHKKIFRHGFCHDSAPHSVFLPPALYHRLIAFD